MIKYVYVKSKKKEQQYLLKKHIFITRNKNFSMDLLFITAAAALVHLAAILIVVLKRNFNVTVIINFNVVPH